ncbi:hypothetical protein Tco_0824213 [Tanacetum coccineum]|uniref:Uncharacterized protein n=1 Tax=Tanacetum coccineum TaxID=301880 RepID=A0ABQ5APS1_9ASTR
MGLLSTTKATDPKFSERKCFRDFLVLEFILLRVLKSRKMIGGQIFCSFFVSDDNIEFLEQKDPPHQSWLSILFSKEILYSRMVGPVENQIGFSTITVLTFCPKRCIAYPKRHAAVGPNVPYLQVKVSLSGPLRVYGILKYPEKPSMKQ